MKKTSTIAFLLLAGIFINVRAQNYSKIISDYYGHKYTGKSATDLSHREWKITGTDPSQSMKATVLNLQQTISGIPVMYADAVLLVRGQEVITDRDNFLPVSPETAKQSVKASLSATAAFAAAGKSGLDPKFADTGELYFYPVGTRLVLAYVFKYQEDDLEKMLVVDANSGAVIRDDVTTLSCHFDKNHEEEKFSEASVSENRYMQSDAASLAALRSATYNVFPLPVESPNFGNRAVVSNPWLPESSPVGWHNDGTNDYNTTRGNNVYAYDDSSASNNPGNSPLSSDLNFNYPLNIAENAKGYIDAAVTNLFYTTNKAHDIFYQFGFTETAKNFQATNFNKYKNGEGDYVRAEVQDGGGLDNANFSPAFDGSTVVYPRMQMYLWSPKFIQNLYILEPATENGRQILTKSASFGPKLSDAPVAANLVLSQPLNACTAITNGAVMAGNIAVIERGDCNFVAKTIAAQEAGAKAVIIYNPLATSSFTAMGPADDTVKIPAVLINRSDGDYIKNLMKQQTVKVSLEDDKSKYKYIDGALDNGIIIHEYGHGVTNRLTGIGYGCLDKTKSTEQMGEGWSDYFALMLTYQGGKTPVISRGIGTFAAAQAQDAVGIRPAKYSPDFKINPYTYGNTNTMTYISNSVEQIDVHSIGFVWATILWDMTLKMIDKYGYEPDVLANKTSGNSRSLQLVMDALKLQGCNPSFIDGRNAIIAADKAANDGANECLIWGAFAKRGVGEKASAGDKTSIKDQVEDFTVPAKCAAVLSAQDTSAGVKTPAMLFPNPATDEFYLKTGPVQGKIIVSLYDMAGSLISKNTINQGEPVNVKNLVNGVYIVNAESLSFKISQKLIIKH